MLEKIGGRKLVVSLIVGGSGMAIALGRGDLPPNLLQLFEVIVGAFVGGNIMAQALDRSPKVKPQIVEELVEEAPPMELQPTPELPPIAPISQGVPNEMVVAAFKELGDLINGHAARTQEALDGVMKATQINQQALSVIVDKVMAMNAKLPQSF